MNVVLVQPDIIWESPEDNIKILNHLLDKIKAPADLIVLPEMFTTGFSMNSRELSELPDNKILEWMKEKAQQYNSAITGSLIIREKSDKRKKNNYFNRLYFVGDQESVYHYDKRHLFRMGGEEEHYSAGRKRLTINFREWRICPLICYDLRFPVWSRNREEYDLLLYVANWPALRSDAWDVLLRARAIENQCWVIGVNRTGKDGEGIAYSGGSQLIDPKGKVMLKLGNEPSLAAGSISLEELMNFRNKFPVYKDRDHFKSAW